MYCNYSKDKFGNEITFIIPCWIKDEDIAHWKSSMNNEKKWFLSDSTTPGINMFMHNLEEVEDIYLSLVNEEGWKPQQARAVLPNALKTELVMTGFVSDWKHFFELRDDNSAHPQAQELAHPLHEEFIKRGYING